MCTVLALLLTGCASPSPVETATAASHGDHRAQPDCGRPMEDDGTHFVLFGHPSVPAGTCTEV